VDGNADQSKADILQKLTDQDTDAKKIESLFKQGAKAVRDVRDTNAYLRTIVSEAPSDVILSPQMAQFSNGLTEWRSAAKSVLDTSTLCNSLMAACSGVTNTANTAVVFCDLFPVTPILTKAKRQFFDVQKPADQAEKARASLGRLGLDLRLLDEAMGAIESPVSGEAGPISVLIPLRERIHQVIDSLLKRRPKQEETGKIGEKIRSIGQQCARPALPVDHFERLANDAGPLIKDLSGVKDKDLSRESVRVLLVRGLTFLNAILDGIDEGKLRK